MICQLNPLLKDLTQALQVAQKFGAQSISLDCPKTSLPQLLELAQNREAIDNVSIFMRRMDGPITEQLLHPGWPALCERLVDLYIEKISSTETPLNLMDCHRLQTLTISSSSSVPSVPVALHLSPQCLLKKITIQCAYDPKSTPVLVHDVEINQIPNPDNFPIMSSLRLRLTTMPSEQKEKPKSIIYLNRYSQLKRFDCFKCSELTVTTDPDESHHLWHLELPSDGFVLNGAISSQSIGICGYTPASHDAAIVILADGVFRLSMYANLDSLMIVIRQLPKLRHLETFNAVLIDAAKAQRTSDAQTLLEFGVDANVQNGFDLFTSLHYAALFGNLQMCQSLIAKGANINTLNSVNQKPIDLLPQNSPNYEEIRKMLSPQQ